MPLALYVHVPWCVRKCPYCDFNSHVAPAGGVPFRDYAAALLADLDHELQARPVQAAPLTLFFGGGTPSLLSPEVLESLIGGIRARTGLAADAEVTLEANPGTIERGRFAEYAEAGVNRVSLGAQSFDDTLLRRIGRIHSARETLTAVAELAAAGLGNFNLDLMYGLPGQDVEAALADLEQAIACAPAHVSWYELTLEPGTTFYRHPPRLPGEAAMAGMESRGLARLAAAGYGRYEVSAYARGGSRCRHNLAYWTYADYIGLGPGAHGKRSLGGRVLRTERLRSPVRWQRFAGSSGAVEVRQIAPEARAFEYMLGALRLREGFTWDAFEARTGLDRAGIAEQVAAAAAEGLLEIVGEAIRPSTRGLRFLNELQGQFLPESRHSPTQKQGVMHCP